MTAALQTKNTRPYMKINFDCFESKVFDNQSQRTVYMTLKKFANSNNQCFPSVPKIASVALISVRKVQMTLRELQNKFLIGIEERFRADGSQTSNLYTIYDAPELWTAENAENTKNVENAKDVKNIENTSNIDNETETAKTVEQCGELISILEANGYTVIKNDDVPAGLQDGSVLKPASETVPDNTIMAQDESVEENKTVEIKDKAEDIVVQEKEPVLNNAVTMPENESPTIGKKLMSRLKNIAGKEKEPTSAPTKVTDVSRSNNHLTGNDNTTPVAESQPLERYSLDWIKKYFEYDIMLHDNPSCQKDIDSVMSILYDTLNTTRPTIRINGDDKPSMVVIGKLMKLTMLDIKYAIDKFNEQTDKINNPKAYMLTILYNAQEQQHLDVSNQVKHDMYNATKPAEEQPKKNTYQKPKNQFFEFHQRDVTKEEMDELERKLLGLH